MIVSLRGRVLEVGPATVVLDVGGVGYGVQATAAAVRRAAAAQRAGDEVTLVTHTHVREDALALFGFAGSEEKRLFELLLGIADVGPKLALTIVSAYTPEQIRRAALAGDARLFTSIKGVGRKIAARLVVELKDKLGGAQLAPADPPPAPDDEHAHAREALVALGLSVAEAEEALRDVSATLAVEQRVRLALAARRTA
jgi:Holliday junction DNA helicase RuvA